MISSVLVCRRVSGLSLRTESVQRAPPSRERWTWRSRRAAAYVRSAASLKRMMSGLSTSSLLGFTKHWRHELRTSSRVSNVPAWTVPWLLTDSPQSTTYMFHIVWLLFLGGSHVFDCLPSWSDEGIFALLGDKTERQGTKCRADE